MKLDPKLAAAMAACPHLTAQELAGGVEDDKAAPEDVTTPEQSLGELELLLPSLAQLVRSEDRDGEKVTLEIESDITDTADHLANILGPRGALRMALGLLWHANDSKNRLPYRVFKLIKDMQYSLQDILDAPVTHRGDSLFVHWDVKIERLDLD